MTTSVRGGAGASGEFDSSASLTSELKSPIRREEGLYPGHDSQMLPLLLSSEPVDLPLAKLVSPNIYLSRCVCALIFINICVIFD